MSSTIATFEAVKTAAEQLVALNKTVTAQSIVELVGGSKSTVLNHLRRYRDEVATATAVAEAPPAFLYELADPMVRRIWTAAQQEAANTYARNLAHQAAVYAGLAEENDALVTREVEYQSEIVELQGKIAELTSSLAEAEENIQRASANLQSVSKKLEEETAKLNTAEAVNSNQETHIARLDEVVRALSKMTDGMPLLDR